MVDCIVDGGGIHFFLSVEGGGDKITFEGVHLCKIEGIMERHCRGRAYNGGGMGFFFRQEIMKDENFCLTAVE